MRKLAAIFAVCIAAATTMGAGGDGGPGADRNDNRTVYQIDLTDSEGRPSTIDRIFLLGDGRARVARTQKGIARRNQNRVDYSAVPVIGKLSEHRYDKEDFAPSTLVGTVRAEDNRLLLLIDADAAVQPKDIMRIAVLNGEVAYETRRGLLPGEAVGYAGWNERGREIGTLHWRGDDILLALIRPFVVTDSALW